MVPSIVILFLLSISLKVANAITNGYPVSGHKRYMVYLLQDKSAPHQYSSWLCGGAIIHHLYILTSAACVIDGRNVFVISGYNKYVNGRNMEEDECIMQKRRKIIHACTPKKFEERSMFSEKRFWNYGDICVAKVDVAFNFNDLSYYNICSYPPAPIQVNFMHKFLEGGREVISLGWGHREFYRPDGDQTDLNEEYLRYSAGKITATPECVKTWKFNKERKLYEKNLLEFYICVDRPGNLDEDGHIHSKNEDLYYNCNRKVVSKRMGNTANISETEMDCIKRIALRNGIADINATTGGICQNDHGGPLVTWIGGIETVIGVASMCPITKDMRCRTPYLYTSTVCFNKVIACYLELRM